MQRLHERRRWLRALGRSGQRLDLLIRRGPQSFSRENARRLGLHSMLVSSPHGTPNTLGWRWPTCARWLPGPIRARVGRLASGWTDAALRRRVSVQSARAIKVYRPEKVGDVNVLLG